MKFDVYYDDVWLSKATYFQVHRRRFIQTWAFLEDLALPRSGSVLDIGGVGPVAAFLANERGWVAEQTATDLRYPLQDVSSDRFDLVLCTEVIEHIKDQESDSINDLEAFNYSGVLCLLKELRRVTAPTGAVVISTPNANSYITLHKWLLGEVLLMDPQHVREFSIGELQRVVSQASLKPLRTITVGSWEEDFGGHVLELRRVLGKVHAGASVDRGDNILLAARKV